jgi:hypothetical protein
MFVHVDARAVGVAHEVADRRVVSQCGKEGIVSADELQS